MYIQRQSMYQQYKKNFESAIARLNDSKVQFLFFLAGDLAHPKLIGKLKELKIDKETFYVSPGFTSNNYYYVYQKSMIQYMVDAIKPDTGATVNIIRRFKTRDIQTSSDDIYHGDHLTFGIITNRNKDTIVKSHVTKYTDSTPDDFVFVREAQSCDFVFDASQDVEGARCENIKKVPVYMRDVYDPPFRAMMRVFCRLMMTSYDVRGGNNKNIRRDRQNKSDFLRLEFSTFLGTQFLKGLDIESAQVFFKKKHIIIVADYIDPVRHVFYLDASRTFRAFRGWFRIARSGPIQHDTLAQFRQEACANLDQFNCHSEGY